ncbi:hypothetical protein PA598K_05602 [Paenibacillus sp. 598K]|uniref:hypothetical protein n=1 Tax=Paenibacillus sp. 598K TaxID=1117987 RepID=UPI000FFA610E|nr:hypothetical protein [Paenibacillus sp. 598K]GBF77078.1 hypothetical protein PA598K_05602 [Paenibacillus sp. 598K]
MFQKTVKLQPFVDISEYTIGFEIVSTQFGGDGCVYVLLINQIPERTRGMFVPATLKQPYTYKVLMVENDYIDEIVIEDQVFNYHYVQPLRRHLLLVGARCSYYGAGKYDLNAKVVDYKGRTLREFLLGDGIQNVQVTEKGTIWTSYFDEGVFGNNGWDHPVGAQGLLAWDENGNKLYADHVSDIADCYALNVVHEQEVWFYYYTDFLLGCISGGPDQPKVTFINPEISGSAGFCTDGYHFLFDGGYGKSGDYYIKKHEKSSLSKGQKVHFLNEKSEPLVPLTQDFREDRVLFSENNLLYQVSIEELLG